MGSSPHIVPLIAPWEFQWRQLCQVWGTHHLAGPRHQSLQSTAPIYIQMFLWLIPSYFYHIATSKASKIPTQVPSLLAVTLKLNLFHTWGVVQIVFASPSSTCASWSGCGCWACCCCYGKSNRIIIATLKGKPHFHMPKGSGLTNLYADGSVSRANS